MKLTEEIKQKIAEEFNIWKDKQYAGKSLEERRELGQFFTPAELTIKMIERMDCDSLAGKTILDPTIGAGGLIAACIIAGADPKLCYGNEFDPIILKVCKERLCALGVPEDNLHLGDATFEDDICIDSFGPDYISSIEHKAKGEEYKLDIYGNGKWVKKEEQLSLFDF